MGYRPSSIILIVIIMQAISPEDFPGSFRKLLAAARYIKYAPDAANTDSVKACKAEMLPPAAAESAVATQAEKPIAADQKARLEKLPILKSSSLIIHTANTDAIYLNAPPPTMGIRYPKTAPTPAVIMYGVGTPAAKAIPNGAKLFITGARAQRPPSIITVKCDKSASAVSFEKICRTLFMPSFILTTFVFIVLPNYYITDRRKNLSNKGVILCGKRG